MELSRGLQKNRDVPYLLPRPGIPAFAEEILLNSQ
jgi:hypothetical protein